MAAALVFQHDGAFERVVGQLRADVDECQVLLAVQSSAHALGAERDHGLLPLVHHDVQLLLDHEGIVLMGEMTGE